MKRTSMYKHIAAHRPELLNDLLKPERLKLMAKPEMIRALIKMDKSIQRIITK